MIMQNDIRAIKERVKVGSKVKYRPRLSSDRGGKVLIDGVVKFVTKSIFGVSGSGGPVTFGYQELLMTNPDVKLSKLDGQQEGAEDE